MLRGKMETDKPAFWEAVNESLKDVSRVEVIDHSKDGQGRVFVKWRTGIRVSVDRQDSGRTLKVFIDELKPNP